MKHEIYGVEIARRQKSKKKEFNCFQIGYSIAIIRILSVLSLTSWNQLVVKENKL